ncbi:MAG: YqgE/AlgH family protein [Acidimicrobiales bacterium]
MSEDGAMSFVSHAGRLLVATAAIGDPNFERSVVLLLDHDEDGSLGLVLNRPSELSAAEILPGWSDLTVDPGVVFAGGPVEQEGIIGLGRRTRRELDGPFQVTVGPVGVIDLSAEPVEAVGTVEGIRLFAGYASWGPGQLESELLATAWWIVDADPTDPLTDDPDDLWAAVLRRQPEPLRRWSFYPVDPSLN